MSQERPASSAPDNHAAFRQSRINSLVSVSLNTFWAVAVIVLAFGLWDFYVDRAHWRSAFAIRLIGAAIVVASGLFQKLPGNAVWLPALSKLRLIVAAVTAVAAAAMLDTAYGYGVAGLVVILLAGPYVAIDGPDLLKTNALIVAALVPVVLALPITPFDRIATAVFVFLGIAVSTLLGHVLEASNRRAFGLELDSHRDARTDALTGLANRRAMQERGRVEVKLAKRTSSTVSVILVDLDHFKDINDRYGHEAGDAALITIAAVLKGALRETDALGRWGGEEFIAVLPATAAAGAKEVAERMRLAIAGVSFPGIPDRATISLGVASSQEIDDPVDEWDLLVKEADQRLYRAKREGRNRVVSDAPGL